MDRYEFGRRFEKLVADELRSTHRVLVTADLPVAPFWGPRLEGGAGDLVMPDLQFFGQQRYGWIEVKWKERANRRRDWNRLEHGIDLDKWQHYCDVQATTRMPVYLVIGEGNTGEIRMASLDTLRACGHPRQGTWNNGHGGACINWRRAAFDLVGHYALKEDDFDTAILVWDWAALDRMLVQLHFEFER